MNINNGIKYQIITNKKSFIQEMLDLTERSEAFCLTDIDFLSIYNDEIGAGRLLSQLLLDTQNQLFFVKCSNNHTRFYQIYGFKLIGEEDGNNVMVFGNKEGLALFLLLENRRKEYSTPLFRGKNR